MPSLTKETTLHKNGLTSQRTEEDQITLDLPVTPRLSQTTGRLVTAFLTIPFTPRPARSNGYSNGHNGYTNGHNRSKDTALEPAVVPFVPDPQIDAIISAVLERKTNRATGESLVVSGPQSKRKTASKWAFFLQLPYLMVYMTRTLAIAGLYLIIPLLNLLNVTIPGNLNRLLIALSIIVPGELLVCFILARTIPRSKAKKGSPIAQP